MDQCADGREAQRLGKLTRVIRNLWFETELFAGDHMRIFKLPVLHIHWLFEEMLALHHEEKAKTIQRIRQQQQAQLRSMAYRGR